MAEKKDRFSVSLPSDFYRAVRRHARKDFGDNISFLVRAALVEYFETHYEEHYDPSLKRGGWREREKEDTSQVMAEAVG